MIFFLQEIRQYNVASSPKKSRYLRMLFSGCENTSSSTLVTLLVQTQSSIERVIQTKVVNAR
jgi:sulfate adenylyltransferase subunit 1 (EFTu-like GTPase family)